MAEGILCPKTILSTGSRVKLGGGAFHLNTYSSIRTCIFLNMYQLPTMSRTLCEAWGPWEEATDLISRSPESGRRSGK